MLSLLSYIIVAFSAWDILWLLHLDSLPSVARLWIIICILAILMLDIRIWLACTTPAGSHSSLLD